MRHEKRFSYYTKTVTPCQTAGAGQKGMAMR
jgi:hypothetical protein